MPVITGPEELSAFRNHLDGKKMLALLSQHNGRMQVNLALGVGKSHNTDLTIEEAILSGTYDLVIVFSPTRQILEERKWIKNPPEAVRIVNLMPLPAILCGPELNHRWQEFEKTGLGALGRIKLCGNCMMDCPWPMQYGKSLKGTQVIFGTQAHLERSPDVLNQLARWSGAKKILCILDEANFTMRPFQRRIKREQLQLFVDVLNRHTPKRLLKQHEKWRYLCGLLLTASTDDLRCHDWWMPKFNNEWSIAIQSHGYSLHAGLFHFLAFDLGNFCRSPIESREKAANGDILFASVPNISMDFIIYSGTANHAFSEYRLGKEFASPFEGYSFVHPGTTWFNIASRLGMRKYFTKNAAQVLDFFAAVVARRLQEGKRPLLIAKKVFRDYCAREMEKRLLELGVEACIVTNGWEAGRLSNANVVPLIHYGMIGTNLFEEFDCAYCLTGYYVREDAINGILQDLLGSDMQIPLQISTEGRPLRRKAGVRNQQDRDYDIHTLSQHALDHLEMGTVLQTVGRVRPYTKPREVITFQCAGHPDLDYTEEFTCIGEARKYFDILGSRSARTTNLSSQIQDAREKGLKQREIAVLLGVSTRTIKRYWNSKR